MYYESHLYDGFLLLHKTWIFQVMFIRAVLIKNLTVTDKLNQLQNNSLKKLTLPPRILSWIHIYYITDNHIKKLRVKGSINSLHLKRH